MILRPKNRAQSLRVSFGQLLRAISQEVLRIQRADDSGGSVWRYTFIYKCIYLRLRDISGHWVLKIYMPRYNPILVWYIL